MKLYTSIFLCCAVVSSLAETPGSQKTPIDQLACIAGCWAGNGKGRTVDEHWMLPSGGTMLGMSRTVANGKTKEYEFLQINQDSTGDIYYVARPSGQDMASFKLIRAVKCEFVFENPGHDFPQRILYRLVGPDSLVARIEGTLGGKDRGVDYPMTRVKCF